MIKSENRLIDRCIKAIVYGVGGAVGSRVFMALANIVLSRLLGQDVFGRFSNINSTVNLFVTFSGIGISATLTRYISANKDDIKKQGMYIRTLSKLCLAMSILLSAGLFVFARQISVLSSGSVELETYFRYVAVAVFFAAMSAVEQSVMLGYERFFISSSVQLVRCFIFLVAGYFLAERFGLYGSIWALVISHFVQYSMSIVINKVYLVKKNIPLAFVWNEDIKNALYTFAFPAFVSGLFVLPVNWIGNAILTSNSGFSEMAVFYVANQWMTYITYIPSQMGQIRPIYTDLYVKKDMKSIRKIFLRTTVLTTMLAVAIGAVAILFKGKILGLYGNGYGKGTMTFICMIIVAIVYTAQVQTGFIMQAMGKMWISFFINAVWGVTLITSFLVLKSQGALGYAIAYLIAYTVIFGLQMIVVNIYLKKGEQ